MTDLSKRRGRMNMNEYEESVLLSLTVISCELAVVVGLLVGVLVR